MTTNIALIASFALFAVGSAEVTCAVAGASCTMDTNKIGTCSNSSTCSLTDSPKCNGGESSECTVGDLKGTCKSEVCTYVPKSCGTIGTSCLDGALLIGTCSAGNTCQPVNTCAPATDNGICLKDKLTGECTTMSGLCQYTQAPCADKDKPCLDGTNLIGMCTGTVGGLKCEVIEKHGTCPSGASPGDRCTQDDFVGKCVRAEGKCEYVEAVCAEVGTSCWDTAGLIGKCVERSAGKKCQLSDICEGKSTGNCEDSYLKGTCVAGAKCKYTPKTSCTRDKPCLDDGKLIGLCTNVSSTDTCVLSSTPCADKTADERCTLVADGTTTNGKCVETKGTCRSTDSVRVDYTVELPKEDPQGIADTIGTYKGFLPNSVDVVTVEGACTMREFIPTSSHTDYKCAPDYFFPGKDACPMVCTTGDSYVKKKEHTIKCLSGKWEGDVGTCAKQCPQATAIDVSANTIGATNTQGRNDLDSTDLYKSKITFVKKVEYGELTCNETYNYTETKCVLGCKDGYRVETKSKYGCTGDGASWTGTLGACEESVDVGASVNLVLGANDDISAGKADFEKRMREAIATNLTGVDPEHVSIKSIVKTTNLNTRRLNERSVQVDYSVQVAKGDPKAATELDKDDGRLLRGIQEGLRGIQ